MSDLKDEIGLPWQDHSLDYWVEEQIWGHRILDSQTPWLVFLELLGVVSAVAPSDNLFDEKGKYYPLTFHPQHRMTLRNLLYNNPIMGYLHEKFPDENRVWSEWESYMRDNASGVADRDFSYIRRRFSEFASFKKLIAMLQSETLESETSRSWSVRFLFPFGSDCLYEEVRVSKTGKASRERNYFGRTGELLYLMLCRSDCALKLRPHFQEVVSNRNPWNSLVSSLQNESSDHAEIKGWSFLPYKGHKSFDVLGQDLLHIFDLKLPGFDAYPHLALLASFHLMLYQLNVARDIANTHRPIMVCEIVAPRKTLVRELSIQSFQANSQLSERAVSAFIDRIAISEEWQNALKASDAYPKCKELLIREVAWPRGETDYGGAADPDSLLKSLRQRALGKHRQHAGSVHRSYGRSVGLISKRGTNKLRYAPNDAFLKALILANVKDRMEFKLFLRLLFDRYGIVVGEREAESVMEDTEFDKKAFKANAARLEQRLSSLGMVKRLSDACAYVLNPYAEVSR